MNRMTEENKLLMNGQEVLLKNPGTKGLGDFLKLAKAMSKIPKDSDGSDFMNYLDDGAIESVTKLINLTLTKTFGEITEEVDAWGMENAMLILPKVIEMCSPKNVSDDASRKEELMKKINDDKQSA